jgi:hypothetical protein
MHEKDFDPNNSHQRMQEATNAAGRKMFGSTPETEIKVQIFPDKSVSPGKFVANKTLPGTYRAHPTTIAAMRTDLFAGANNEPFVDLELNIKCEGCGEIIDVQFWKICPYCEAQLPKELHKCL